jgi:hypothetical protein
MKHTLKVSEDGSLFTVTTEGDGDVEGIIAFLKDIISHPKWQPGKHILLDHRALKIHDITVPGIEDVSVYFKSIARVLGNGKIALVMNRVIDFGIARAWENITGYDVAIEIYVFRQLDEAISWLKKFPE